MQEEIERKTVCLVFKGAKLTTEMLAAGIKKALDTGLNTPHKEHEKHGEMKLKDLVGKGGGAESKKIDEAKLNTFRKTAAKYKVDFSVQEGRNDNGETQFFVFFQGKDKKVIQAAFNEMAAIYEAKEAKKSLRNEVKKNKEKAAEEKARKTKERTAQRRRTKELSR